MRRGLLPSARPSVMSAAISRQALRDDHPCCAGRPAGVGCSMQAEKSIVVDPKSPGGINSPHGLILFDGVCVLCSRGCRFVSKRDRRGYFRFVPIQLAGRRPLAEQLGVDPDHSDSFAFLANGQAYVKSEAVLRIARELPRWQWTWIFQFIPRVIRDAIWPSRRLHPAEFGSFVAIMNRPETAGRWRLALVGCGRHDEGSSVAAFQLSPYYRKHNLPDQLRMRPSSDRSGIV
jgi:predicted DCC family thiol-disulfide oxidoreductase YuxK